MLLQLILNCYLLKRGKRRRRTNDAIWSQIKIFRDNLKQGSRRIWIVLLSFFSCQVFKLFFHFNSFYLVGVLIHLNPAKFICPCPPNSIPTRGTLTVENGKLLFTLSFCFYSLQFGFEMLENVFVVISNSYSFLCYCRMLAIYSIWMDAWMVIKRVVVVVPPKILCLVFWTHA